MKLQSSFKTYTYGQDKADSPDKVIEKAASSLEHAKIEILQRVFRIDDLDRLDIPAFICKSGEEFGGKMGLTDSFGKGATIKQANASALMEHVERLSCLSFINTSNNFKIASHAQVKDRACELAQLILPFQKTSYRNDPDIINDLKQVPLCWTDSFSLTKNRDILYPVRWFYYMYGTTGFAAGNTMEEAILQGLCEVVERHCISSVVLGQMETPYIAPDSIKNKIAKNLIAKFQKAGIELFIRDFSLGIGIPTIQVLAYDSEASLGTIRIYNAAGTHMNSNNALIRALTEVALNRAQVLFVEGVEKKQGGPTYCYPSFKNLDEAPYLTDKNEEIAFDSIPTYSNKDFKKEIEKAVAILSDHDLEVMVTDVTHPVLKIPSVIVSIPGTRLNRPTTKINPYFLMGRGCMGINRYKEAVKCLEKALKLNPEERNNPKMLARMGLCYKKIRGYKKAADYFQNAIELDPRLIHAKELFKDLTFVLKKISS